MYMHVFQVLPSTLSLNAPKVHTQLIAKSIEREGGDISQGKSKHVHPNREGEPVVELTFLGCISCCPT